MDREIQNAVDSAEEYSEPLDAAIERLSQLSKREYEQCRKAEAKKFDVRVQMLDRWVREARAGDGDGGDGLQLYEPEPWDDEVDGADLLDRMVIALKRYVVMPNHAAEATALWAVHAHAFDCWQNTPRLSISAPVKGAGKSVMLDVLGCLVPRPIEADNLSGPVTFRVIDKFKPTILADEVDTYLSTDRPELIGILNSGHCAGGKSFRCQGDNHDVKAFSTHCPVVMAGIGHLPATLADRSIPVKLQRKTAAEHVESFRSDRVGHLRDLARQAARFVIDNEAALRDADPDMPPGIFNRAADNWRALLSVADVSGGEWPERARQAAVALSASVAGEADSFHEQLIGDIFLIFERDGRDRLPTSKLIEELVSMDDRPWPEYKRGKPITPAQIANLLKPFAVTSTTIRIDGAPPIKGYKKSAFKDVFRRYPPSQAVTTLQATDTGAYSDFHAVTNDGNVTAPNRPEPALSKGCNVVTAEKGGGGPITSNAPDLEPVCIHCKKVILADDETIPVAGGGDMHGHCYPDWLENLEPRGASCGQPEKERDL